jgi:predicted enzyme related to lactoylglutathione lyase
MSLFKGVSVVSYYVVDWEKAKKFYQETLGWPVAWADDKVGWAEYGRDNEAHISINRWEGPEPVPPKIGGAVAVLNVDDAKQVTSNLRTRGIKCDDVVDIPGVVCYGTFYDPEGNRIQFSSNPSS